MSNAGQRLIEAAEEAVAIARGDVAPARIFIPADINVRDIRAKVGFTQDDFATVFGFSVNQIRDWEQGRNRPLGGVRAYLTLIERKPDVVMDLLKEMRQTARAA